MGGECLHETVCDAVKELKKQVERHEKQINESAVSFALIKRDLDYIKSAIDKKKRFNTEVITMVLQAVCTLIMTVIVGLIGLN